VFSNLSIQWKSLADVTKQAWEAAAITTVNALGQTYVLSPNAAFMRVNMLRNRAGLGSVTTPPLAPASIDSPSITPTWTAGALSIVYSPPTVGVLQIWAAKPQNGATGFPQGWRLLGNRGVASASPFVATTNWAALFGAAVPGNVSPLRSRIVYPDGSLTAYFEARPTIA
jgi:hypothetical protein